MERPGYTPIERRTQDVLRLAEETARATQELLSQSVRPFDSPGKYDEVALAADAGAGAAGPAAPAGAEQLPEFKYGEIYFQETGVTAPYIIVPRDRTEKELVETMAKMKFNGAPLVKPSIFFEVRANGISYIDEAKDVIDNEVLHDEWFPEDEYGGASAPALAPAPEPSSSMGSRTLSRHSEVATDPSRDQKVRKFADRTLNVFKDVVKGVSNADGWFLNSAGRGACHQLIGDSIETFDGLEETVWVNFASLENEHLFAAPEGAGMVFDGEEEKYGAELHEWLVNEIRTKAEVIPNQPAPGQKRVMLPALKRGQVMYNEPATKFPTLEDLQSRPNLTSWIEGEVGKLGEKKENHLHPRSTHLIFFEDAGFSRGGGQQVPWNFVDGFKKELAEVQGAAEGLLIMSGSILDFNRAAAVVSKSNPVITFKSVGGASEQLSKVFEAKKRKVGQGHDENGDGILDEHQGAAGGEEEDSRALLCFSTQDSAYDSDDLENPRSMEASEQFVSKNYAESAIDAKFRAVNIDGAVERAVPEELIVIDLHPKNVSAGTKCQKQMAEMLTMVGGDEERQLGFRPAERQYTAKAWDHSIRFAENAEVEQTQSSLLNYSMLLIALLLVVVVVLKQAVFPPLTTTDRCGHTVTQVQHTTPSAWNDPLRYVLLILPIVNGLLMSFNTKFNPLKKHTLYHWASMKCVSETYKYRARASPYNKMPSTVDWVLEEESAPSAQAKKPLSRKYVDAIMGVVSEVMSSSAVAESSLQYEADDEDKRRKRKSRLDALPKGYIKDDETAEAVTLQHGKMPKKIWMQDDGYSQLTVHDYIACRTVPQLALMQQTLPPLSARKDHLQMLMYFMSALSVVFATVHADLYIAVSTAAISLCTGILEYQKLEVKVASLNRSIKELSKVLHDWDSCTFVERRKAWIKDQVVERTESAVMAEVELFHSMAGGEADSAAKPGEGEDQANAPEGGSTPPASS